MPVITENGESDEVSQETIQRLLDEDVVYGPCHEYECGGEYHMVDEAIDRMGGEQAVWDYIGTLPH